VSIDYAYSFGVSGTTGVGDPNKAYTHGYFAELHSAIKENGDALERAIHLAEGIPNNVIEELIRSMPVSRVVVCRPNPRISLRAYRFLKTCR
jgi:hypothetical protein